MRDPARMFEDNIEIIWLEEEREQLRQQVKELQAERVQLQEHIERLTAKVEHNKSSIDRWGG